MYQLTNLMIKIFLPQINKMGSGFQKHGKLHHYSTCSIKH